MIRYIDANALLSRLPEDLPYKASVKRVIMQAPTADVVEVVRCKDCVFSQKGFEEVDIYCKLNDASFGKDSFCSYGERSENGT